MSNRMAKILLIWNAVLTVLLLASFALNVNWVQAANDPPVKIFSANADTVGGDYSSSTSGVSVNSNTPVNLLSTTVTLSQTKPSTCLVTASLIANAAGHGSTHNVGLSLDNTTSEVIGSDREIYFPTTVGVSEVTSVYGFTNLLGTHTIYFVGTGTPSITVSTRSMVVACFTTRV